MNRMPYCIIGFKCLLKLLSCSSLGSSFHLKVFGCIFYVHVPKSDRTKLDSKALKSVFLKYAPNQKSYTCYYPSIRKWIIFTDVTLHETIPFYFFFIFFWTASSSGGSRLEGEDELSLPLHVLPLSFNSDGGH